MNPSLEMLLQTVDGGECLWSVLAIGATALWFAIRYARSEAASR